MFFPQTPWWDSAKWTVPDSLKYLCERWWELLKDWHSITVYTPPCSSVLSILEDVADVLEDFQDGRIRSSHQIESLHEELSDLLKTDNLLRRAFPSEVDSTLAHFAKLFDKLPADPQNKFAELKKRRTDCHRAASAARRLHHRCQKRRTADSDMVWPGFGGLIGSELIQELESDQPNFAKIDRILVALLIDCLYRGYDLDYLTTLFERYLPDADGLRSGVIHVFRRLHSLLRHEYHILFVLRGASSVTIEPGRLRTVVYSSDSLDSFGIQGRDKTDFLSQFSQDASVVLGLDWTGAADAGSAAEASRRALQEIIDYLDFQSPTQKFELGYFCVVSWKDNDGKPYYRLHPDNSGAQRPHSNHSVEIEADWAEQLGGLAEALRWSSVARRERTPEVSLLACWFAFEFLAGTLERTPVEGIMDFFPKVLAIGDLKRRLIYWSRSLQASPGFDEHPMRGALTQKMTFTGGNINLLGVVELLTQSGLATPTPEGSAVREIAAKSVLLRERTFAEAKLFSNQQLVAQTMAEAAKQVQRELQGFLVIRNKLVHRARIDHPLLPVVSRRARSRLYDLLRDISGQLTTKRLRNSVDEVLHDYRDTFEELQSDLGQNKVDAKALIQRITLS